MADGRTLDRLVVVGASHRTSSEATRDRLFISEDDLPAFLRKVSDAGFSSLVVMATCARTEIFGFAENPAMARDGAVAVLAGLGSFDRAELEPQIYFHSGDQALSHLFRVASSMDSPIVGEPEVTGQFRDAVRLAEAHSFIGGFSRHGHMLTEAGEIDAWSVGQECVCDCNGTSTGIFCVGGNSAHEFVMVASCERPLSLSVFFCAISRGRAVH